MPCAEFLSPLLSHSKGTKHGILDGKVDQIVAVAAGKPIIGKLRIEILEARDLLAADKPDKTGQAGTRTGRGPTARSSTSCKDGSEVS